MNARERIENLWDRAAPIGPLLDAYAHELADKIRDSEQLRDLTDDHMHDCEAAADLIDPIMDGRACRACDRRSNR